MTHPRELTILLAPEEQHATLKLIDQRQDQLLEDLERLDRQILDIIEVYAQTRPDSDEAASDTTPVDTSATDVAA